MLAILMIIGGCRHDLVDAASANEGFGQQIMPVIYYVFYMQFSNRTLLNFYVYQDLPQFIDFLIDLKSKHTSVKGFAIKQFDDKLHKNGPRRDIILIFRGNIYDWK